MIKKSLDVFKNDIGRYPTQEEGLLHLIENIGLAGWDGPYLSRERIRDPWGEMYKYSFDVVNDLPFFIGTSGKNKRWDTNNEEALKRTVNSDDVIIWLGTKTGVNK